MALPVLDTGGARGRGLYIQPCVLKIHRWHVNAQSLLFPTDGFGDCCGLRNRPCCLLSSRMSMQGCMLWWPPTTHTQYYM